MSINIYKHEHFVTLDGKPLDVSDRFNKKIKTTNLPDLSWKMLSRKSGEGNIAVAKMKTGYKVTLMAQNKMEAKIMKEAATRMDASGRAKINIGNEFLIFEGTANVVYSEKKAYLEFQTQDLSIDGAVLDSLLNDRLTHATDIEVKKRAAFFKALAENLGKTPATMIGGEWQKAHAISTTGTPATVQEVMLFTANTGGNNADKLVHATAQTDLGKRIIDLGGITDAKIRGEAIYNWIHGLVIYAKRIGSTNEPTHPTITDGLFNLMGALCHDAELSLKKFITGGQPLPTITLEGKELPYLQVQDTRVILIPLEEKLKTLDATTGGAAKEIYAIMQGTGENAPIEHLEFGNKVDEVVQAPEALDSSKDRLWNHRSKVSGDFAVQTELYWALVK